MKLKRLATILFAVALVLGTRPLSAAVPTPSSHILFEAYQAPVAPDAPCMAPAPCCVDGLCCVSALLPPPQAPVAASYRRAPPALLAMAALHGIALEPELSPPIYTR